MSCNRIQLRELGRQCQLFSQSYFDGRYRNTWPKGHRIRPHDVISIPGFFFLDPTGIFTRRNSFFLQREAGVGVCMRTQFVTPLVCQKINGMYQIFLSGVSDFWKSFLFVSTTKNLMHHIFFIRYIRFVLIRNLFLFEDPR